MNIKRKLKSSPKTRFRCFVNPDDEQQLAAFEIVQEIIYDHKDIINKIKLNNKIKPVFNWSQLIKEFKKDLK